VGKKKHQKILSVVDALMQPPRIILKIYGNGSVADANYRNYWEKKMRVSNVEMSDW
jgi:hypothetical protein